MGKGSIAPLITTRPPSTKQTVEIKAWADVVRVRTPY